MNYMKHMHILSFLCIFLPAYISADIIKLIDGQTAKCKIIDTTGNKIVIDRGGKISKINKRLVVSYQIGDSLSVGKKEVSENTKAKSESNFKDTILFYISNCEIKRGRIRMSSSLNICDCIFIGDINPILLSKSFEILKEKLSKSLKIKLINPSSCAELLESKSDSLSYLLLLREIDTKREEGTHYYGGGFTATGTLKTGSSQEVFIFRSSLHATVVDLKLKTIILDRIINARSDEAKGGQFEEHEKKVERFIKAKDRAIFSLFNKLGGKIYDKIKYVPDSKNTRRR